MENLNLQSLLHCEENNQQPLLSHHPPRPPIAHVQNLHPVQNQVPVPVTCSSGESDQSACGLFVSAGLDHDNTCALSTLNTRRRNNINTGRAPSESSSNYACVNNPNKSSSVSNNADVAQESVDLLRMLPRRESNPRRANRMYGVTNGTPNGGAGGGGSLLGVNGPAHNPAQGGPMLGVNSGPGGGGGSSLMGVNGPASTPTQTSAQPPAMPPLGGSMHRDPEPDSAPEDSSGFCDDSVVYYTSIPCTHGSTGRGLGGLGGLGGSSGRGGGGGGMGDPEERIAFLSSTYSTLNRNKRNNGGVSMIEDRARGASNVAEYCTSKSHSRSCGNLTCPRYDKNRLGRSLKQIYPDYKNKRKKSLKNIKRWTFLTAIFIGIILAITGIIVAFLVYAPFHLGTKQCRSGYVSCGESGCILPQRVCSRDVQCPRAIYDAICNNKTEPSKQGGEEWPPITLSPLARGDDKFFEPDPQGWIFYREGSINGSRYVTIHKPMTFYGAQDACRDQGGHLAHVNTIREQVFIEEYLKQILTRHNFPSDLLGFWVGARRSRGSHAGTCQYDQWKWVDAYGQTHDAVRGFSAFVPGKPDNFYKPEECLYLTTELPTRDEGFLKWDDAPCDIHGIGNIMAVCEVEQRTIFRSWGD